MSENNDTLVPIRPQDWEPIRLWRNAQTDILRQDHIITEKEQIIYSQWYNRKIKEDQPEIVLFSFLLNNELIGYGGFGRINWKDNWAETSFLLNPTMMNADIYEIKYYYMLFIVFHKLLRDRTVALGLHRWYSETFAFRIYHIHCLEEYGFKKEGILIDHIRKNGKYIDVVVHGKILR